MLVLAVIAERCTAGTCLVGKTCLSACYLGSIVICAVAVLVNIETGKSAAEQTGEVDTLGVLRRFAGGVIQCVEHVAAGHVVVCDFHDDRNVVYRCIMLRVVDTRCVYKVGILQTKFLGSGVHHLDERCFRACNEVCKTDARISAAWQNCAVEHISCGNRLACLEACHCCVLLVRLYKVSLFECVCIVIRIEILTSDEDSHNFSHVTKGFEELIDLGLYESRACLTHSFINDGRFNNNEIPDVKLDYINNKEHFNSEYDDLSKLLRNITYTDYDRILNIADLMASDHGILSPIDRIYDILSRRGELDKAPNRIYFLTSFYNTLLWYLNSVGVNTEFNYLDFNNLTLDEIYNYLSLISNIFYDEIISKNKRK